jgi:hypothetical protein
MENKYDVITTTDKAKRDEIFRQMRASDDPLERASVKFSGNQPVLVEEGLQAYTLKQYEMTGKGGKTNYGRPQQRGVFISTWSVATPRPERSY